VRQRLRSLMAWFCADTAIDVLFERHSAQSSGGPAREGNGHAGG
jgi:hypothetical protein